ncbi:GNAT family N-acetyltransferase [Angustibacter aerolatus]
MDATLRPARPDDGPALDDVCVRTGAAGGDARGRGPDDDLLPDVWLRPYLLLEPELAWVVEDDEGPGGYVVGTADTRRFAAREAAQWLPGLRARRAHQLDDPRVAHGLDPALRLHEHVDAYPAHLHVDLLPRLAGGGWGRRLIETFAAAAHEAGADGLHVGVDPANVAALGFYERLGFVPLPSSSGPLLGVPLPLPGRG